MTDLICDGIFDARIFRESKSKKGIFLTLEIAADDYYAAKLENLRPNALLKLGYQELTDVSVQPIEQASGNSAASSATRSASVTCPAIGTAAPQSGEETAATPFPKGGDANTVESKSHTDNTKLPHAEQSATHGARDRKRFNELPYSQQAGVRCGDSQFRRFLERREGYALDTLDQESAAQCVRRICGVQSRSELSTNASGLKAWRKLELDFQQHLTQQMHAGSYR